MNVLPRRHWSSTIFFPCNTCLPQRGRKENERENEKEIRKQCKAGLPCEGFLTSRRRYPRQSPCRQSRRSCHSWQLFVWNQTIHGLNIATNARSPVLEWNGGNDLEIARSLLGFLGSWLRASQRWTCSRDLWRLLLTRDQQFWSMGEIKIPCW